MAKSKGERLEYLNILDKHRGLVTYACNEYGIDVQTHYNWMKDPEFAQKVKDINEKVIDWVERKLYDNVDKLDNHSIFFYLKAKAKRRGYGEDKQDNNFTFNIKLNNDENGGETGDND